MVEIDFDWRAMERRRYLTMARTAVALVDPEYPDQTAAMDLITHLRHLAKASGWCWAQMIRDSAHHFAVEQGEDW